MEQEAKAPVSPFLLYGAIIGGVAVVVNLVFYLTGMIAKGWTSYLMLFIMFGALIGTLFMYRAEHLGGYGYYKQYLGITILSVLLASLISALFWFMMITLIDSSILDQQKLEAQKRIPKTLERFEKLAGGFSAEEYDDALEESLDKIEQSKVLNTPWINALMSFIGSFFMLLPLSFLAPVFALRKRPEGAPVNLDQQ